MSAGKYDLECEALLKRLNAKGVALVVVGGKNGNGFSLSFLMGPETPAVMKAVAMALEEAAKDLKNA